MSRNGNGNSATVLVLKSRKKPAAPSPAPEAATSDENSVTFKTSEGIIARGLPVHVQRHAAVFELYGPVASPRLSESLADFKIMMQGREVYSGHAVVSNLVDAGTKIVCEVNLDLMDWVDLDLLLAFPEGQAEKEIKTFLDEWQKNYRIPDEFKIVVADMQAFFHDLRLLLDRMELRLQAQSPSFRDDLKMARSLAGAVLPLIDFFFEKFEETAKRIRGEDESACMHYMRQRLQPLVLSAPFANHTITKPRGYAGDFEMVNMIERDGFEGESLFAQILHRWFVQQPPARAHRNRIQYLADCIETEVHRVSRVSRHGRPARILNFACGPAFDVQHFVSRSIVANEAEFTLEDFDDGALAHCQHALLKLFNARRLDTMALFKRKSIYQLMKDSQLPGWPPQKRFDFVYCAGLFDYLPENTCQQLMNIFYDLVSPGGLLLATNVNSINPLRYGMEHLLDWHLIYRNEAEIRALAPRESLPENVRVRADETGVNLFLEIRKPEYV